MCEILIIINLYESKLGVNALVPKREWVCPPADTGSVCRLGVQQNVGKYSTGNQGSEARDAAKHPTVNRGIMHSKEKPCPKWSDLSWRIPELTWKKLLHSLATGFIELYF